MNQKDDSMQEKQKRENERGNVMIYILIAVILFAALSYAVSGMMRGDGANIGEEKARIVASDILNYGRAMRQAVQDMRISNGCDETDIRFVTNELTGYGTSVRAACDIFDTAGGDIAYLPPEDDAGGATEWLLNGSNIVADAGTGSADLILVLQNVNQMVCDAINEASGITDVGTDSAIDFSKFTGTYAETQTIDAADGHLFGCLNYVNSGDNFFYYQVLITR